jgi:hypothetical protein
MSVTQNMSYVYKTLMLCAGARGMPLWFHVPIPTKHTTAHISTSRKLIIKETAARIVSTKLQYIIVESFLHTLPLRPRRGSVPQQKCHTWNQMPLIEVKQCHGQKTAMAGILAATKPSKCPAWVLWQTMATPCPRHFEYHVPKKLPWLNNDHGMQAAMVHNWMCHGIIIAMACLLP